jgi:hypothetical protein
MQNTIELCTISAEKQLQKPDFDIQAPKIWNFATFFN